MRSQLKRAKGRLDSHDLQLHSSLLAILNDKDDGPETMEILEKLAEKLDLRTPGAIRQENRALQEMMLEKDNSDDDGCEHDLSFQQLFTVLRKLTSILPSEDTDDETPELDRVNIAAGVFISKSGPVWALRGEELNLWMWEAQVQKKGSLWLYQMTSSVPFLWI